MGARGRQPLPEGVKRDHRVSFFLNTAELEELEQVTGVAGLADLVMNGGTARHGHRLMQERLRVALLRKQAEVRMPTANKDVLVQISRMGSNVNQIAASLNAGAMNARDRTAIRAVLEELELAASVVRGAVQQAAAPSSQVDLDLLPQF